MSAPASDYDAQTKAFIDRLTTPVLEFAIDAGRKRVLFRGGLTLEGTNFKAVDALLGNFRKAKAEDAEVPFLSATSLADRLQISDQSMRQQLRRLREALEPLAVNLGIPLDQGTFIGASRVSVAHRLWQPRVNSASVWRNPTRSCGR